MAFEQRDLDNLSEELKYFTEGMRDFISKGGFKGGGNNASTDSSTESKKISVDFDKSTQKIVNALGNLSAELTKNNRATSSKTKYLEEFNKSVEKSTKVQEEGAIAEAKIAAEKHARETEGQKRSAEALKRHSDSQELLRKKNLGLVDAYKEATEGMEFSSRAFSKKFEESSPKLSKAVEIASKAFDVIAKSVTGYSSALYNGERGAKVTAKAMTELVTPITELSGAFGNMALALSIFMPGGLIAKGLVFAVGLAAKAFEKGGQAALKYNELASEQADTLYKSFVDLSKGGVALSGGLSETFETMQQFGMSVAEATQFTSLLTSSAKDLKYLGTTAGQGAKEFSKVAGTLYKSDVGKQLELLGVSAEEQRDSALKFMSIQARTGQIQNKNTTDLVKASAAFTKELDLAAQLAGDTRKEQMESREAAMKEVRFRSAMAEAQESGDTRRIQELELAQTAAAQLKAAGDEEGATGLLQLITGRGAMATEASVKANMQYGGGNLYELFSSGKFNKDNLGELMGAMGGNAKTMNRQMSGVNQIIGETPLQTTGVGSYDFTARQDALKKGMADAGFKGTIDEFLRTEQGKRITEADAKTASQTELRRTQQNTALMMDKFVNSFIDVSKINENAAKIFSAAVDKFGGKNVNVTGGNLSTSPAGGNLSTSPAGGTAKSPGMSSAATGGFFSSRGGGISGDMMDVGQGSAIMDAAAEGAAQKSGGNLSTSPAGGIGSSTMDAAAERAAQKSGTKSSSSQSPGQGSPISGNSVTSSTDALALLSFGNESGSRENFLQLDSDIQQKVLAAAVDYNQQTGNKLKINSAMRSFEKQQELYDAYISGKSKFPAAKPGTSLHESGRAVDIEQGKNDAVAIASLIKQGLSQPVKNDPVHFQARTGGIFKGPSTGYNVEMHDEEIVIPANEGVSKQALNTSMFNQDTSMIDTMIESFRVLHDQNYQIIDLLSRQADNGDKLVQAAY